MVIPDEVDRRRQVFRVPLGAPASTRRNGVDLRLGSASDYSRTSPYAHPQPGRHRAADGHPLHRSGPRAAHPRTSTSRTEYLLRTVATLAMLLTIGATSLLTSRRRRVTGIGAASASPSRPFAPAGWKQRILPVRRSPMSASYRPIQLIIRNVSLVCRIKYPPYPPVRQSFFSSQVNLK